MNATARTTLNSFHYLFLQYAFYEPSLYGNHVIEVELERFLEALAQEMDTALHPSSIIASNVIQELMEGDYLHKCSPHQFKQQIREAIIFLLGYENEMLCQFYFSCVDYVATKLSALIS